LFARYQLGERLHKTRYEVDAMTRTEFVEWLAYFKMKENPGGH
jgi:hypothetical protein